MKLTVFKKWLQQLLSGGRFRSENIGPQACRRIACETFSGIMRSLPWHLIFIPVFLLLYCIILSQWIEYRLLAGWYVLVVLSSMVPIGYLYYLYHRDGAAFNYSLAEMLLVFAGGLTSLFVGLSSWWFFDAIPGHIVLLLIVALSLGPAVIAVAFAGSMVLWLSITLNLMAPIVSYVLFAWGHDSIVSGSMFGSWLLMYLGYTFFIAYKQNIFVKENLYLKYQLEESLKTRSQYLEIASHDLRQPMHAMGLFIEALEPHVSNDGKLAYSKLQGAVRALRGLFDSLLDMARLDAKLIKVDLQSFALQPVLTKLVGEFKAAAQEKGLQLTLACEPVTVRSDLFLLERVLRNLLSNAIKFTEQGEVTLRCQWQTEQLRIEVCDQGCGIDEAELENIFSEYHQLDPVDEMRTRGLGLGLAIVKRISALLDMPVTVKSTRGLGSSFSFVIPLVSQKDQVATTARSHPVWDLSGLMVVVIDDEPDVLTGMAQLLDLWGCQILSGDSLPAVLDQISEATDSPAIIIADYRLAAGATGIEAIVRIRDEFNMDIPGLLITGDTVSKRLEEADKNDLMLMHKPISPASLRSAIYQSIKAGDKT